MLQFNRETGNWEGSCDFCSTETIELPNAEDFRGAVRTLKDHGWRVFKDDEGQWQHSCVNCDIR